MLFYIQASKCGDQEGRIDTSNTNICQLVIILWQNILKQQYVAQTHSSLPYLKEIFIARHTVDLYYTAVGLEKMNREQRDRQRTENIETNYRGHSYPDGLPG